jgi:hypothetical protein
MLLYTERCRLCGRTVGEARDRAGILLEATDDDPLPDRPICHACRQALVGHRPVPDGLAADGGIDTTADDGHPLADVWARSDGGDGCA